MGSAFSRIAGKAFAFSFKVRSSFARMRAHSAFGARSSRKHRASSERQNLPGSQVTCLRVTPVDLPSRGQQAGLVHGSYSVSNHGFHAENREGGQSTADLGDAHTRLEKVVARMCEIEDHPTLRPQAYPARRESNPLRHHEYRCAAKQGDVRIERVSVREHVNRIEARLLKYANSGYVQGIYRPPCSQEAPWELVKSASKGSMALTSGSVDEVVEIMHTMKGSSTFNSGSSNECICSCSSCKRFLRTEQALRRGRLEKTKSSSSRPF